MPVAVAVLLLSLSVFASVVWADQAGASSAISSARVQIASCVDVAREAEAAGADIAGLALIVNEAGLLLSQAEFAFSVGDFVGAQGFAFQSQGRLVSFVSDANALRVSAEGAATMDFLVNVVGSIVGTVGVLVGGFGVWRYLSRKNRKDEGPEVFTETKSENHEDEAEEVGFTEIEGKKHEDERREADIAETESRNHEDEGEEVGFTEV